MCRGGRSLGVLAAAASGGRKVTPDDANSPGRELVGLLGPIAHDAERLLALHGALLRSELRQGARDYVVKPVDRDELLAKISSLG